MTKGGARPRAGRPADPNSARSEEKRRATAKSATSTTSEPAITAAEFNPLALSAAGRKGRAPAFPLPKIHRFKTVPVDGGKPIRVIDTALSNTFRKRELQIWGQVWRSPQALAWERETWRWPTIAKYCRIMTSTEAEPDASAALLSRERELRNECGLSPDGLKQNGWAIAPDQLAGKRAAKKVTAPAEAKATPVRRLRG